MKRHTIAAVVLLALVAVVLPVVQAQDLPELKFEKYELPNGLDVILHEDHTIPVVAVNVMYHVGSKNEVPGRTGFAHLFEHMMFQGSEHFNHNFTDGIMKYGGSRNGSTGIDRTNYWENMPSNYLEKTLWLEADRMGYLLPAVTQERLDIQRSVVMNEKRENTDDQPYGQVQEIQRRLMYPDEHPYSWPTIGSMEDLEAASLEDVKDFFRQYYTPNNASLCIAGDFDPAQAKEWVEKYFGPIPAGPPIHRLETWVPELKKEIRATLEDNVELPRLYMAWHTPPYYHPGDAEFDLLASVLSSGKSSRLYKALVYDQQIAQDVVAFQASGEIGSTFNIIVTARKGHTLKEMEQQVEAVLNDVLTNGIGADEFERVRVNWEAGFVRALQNVGGFGGRADILNSYNTYLGDPGMLLWDKGRYSGATTDGTIAYARRYLKPDARFVLYVQPQGELAPVDNGVDMAVEPGPQDERSFTPPDVRTATLSNGLELYLVENHKLPLLQVNLLIKSGWAADPIDRPGAAAITADLLTEGTKNRTALDISDESQKLGLNFGSGSSFDNTTITLNVLKKNLDPALNMMADVAMNPTFPQDELDRLKKTYLGRIQQESSQALTVGIKSFFRELYGADHPYGQPYTGTGTKESIDAITRSDLESFYKANFMPNNAAVVVVGDITLDEAKSRIEKAFKGWKHGKVESQAVRHVTPLEKTKVCIVDMPGIAQSTIILGNLVGPRNDAQYLPTTVVSQVLGGGPSARLYKNIREDKGYTYGAYSFVGSRRGQGMFAAYAQVQADVTKESIIEFLKEFRGITGEIPVSEEELTNARNKLVKGFPQNFQTVQGVAGELNTKVTFDLPLDQWKTYTDQVNGVDVDKLLATARATVHPDALLIVVVGDRAKIEDKIRELNLGEIYYSDMN